MSAQSKLKAHENSVKIENALRAVKFKGNSGTNVSANNNAKHDPTIYIDENGNQFKTTERIAKDVVPPVSHRPSNEEVFSNPNGMPNFAFLRDHFKREGKLEEHQVIKILRMAKNVLTAEPNLLTVPSPVTVCGDIHGQFYDLCKLFEICGDPSDSNSFLFLGDYVDRGTYSIEVLLLLYAMKLNFPTNFYLLRGNHETKQMTTHFTFKNECSIKYSNQVYKEAIDSFKALPICAIMNKQFFCVHGGISPRLKSIKDISTINRFQADFPSSGLYCDLMWADPSNDYDTEEFMDTDDDNVDDLDLMNDESYFSRNYDRGCSYVFTYKAACKFLKENGLLSIIRAHQAQDAGYRMYKKTQLQQFPSVITLFSAPNYCDTYGNKAAVLKYQNAVMNIRQFGSSPVPYHLPNLIDVFSWSIPFVAERSVDILLSILNICSEEELEQDTPLARELANSLNDVQQQKKSTSLMSPKKDNSSVSGSSKTAPSFERNELRNKILAIGRVSRMFNILRQEAESVEHLRTLSGGSNLPKGILLGGVDAINTHISSFEEARLADLANEAMPPSEEESKRIEDEKYERLRKKVNNGTSPNTL